MTELHNKILVEKYRPKSFEEVISDNKTLIINHLKNPKQTPSFIFYSNSPGTGKTSMAKVVINYLGCDAIFINSSDERGIDTIREKVSNFASSLSSNPNTKRCVFLDESDSLTKVAQDSLRATMEEFSDNCFFIFACNDLSKIIDPIQSRCVLVPFNKPNKPDIISRIEYICEEEGIKANEEDILKLVNQYYPDMRTMIKVLHNSKIEGKPIAVLNDGYVEFYNAILSGNVNYLYNTTYSGSFDVFGFNRWLFKFLFDNCNVIDSKKLADAVICCAEVEKGWNIGANIEIIFLANMIKISKIMKG